ncbi:MAG: S1 RNA-binding domain-containing protein, partial [Bacteroidia bacterium]|nr:S1 RNA-binding domain-containing protein [Bacteroidia bacterium]
MSSWENFKEQYAKGSVIDLVVSRKAPPGLIFFDFTESIQGSLHVSELNWNFGLSQSDFREINLGDTVRVYVIAFDD